MATFDQIVTTWDNTTGTWDNPGVGSFGPNKGRTIRIKSDAHDVAVGPLPRFSMDPHDILDFSFDFTDWLESDTLSSITWSVSRGIITGSIAQTQTVATIFVSNGVVNRVYEVHCQVTTTAGRTVNRSLEIGFHNS